MSARRPASERRFTRPLFDVDDEAAGLGVDVLEPETAARISDGPPADLPPTARVVAGIDEAGLGPLLGPMTLGYSAFRVPPDVRNLWRALRRVCTDDATKDEKRLVVADSKVVFTRDERSARRLERTALAFLALRDRERRCPRDTRSLLDCMSQDAPASEDASEHPSKRSSEHAIEHPSERASQHAADGSCSFAAEHESEPWHRHLDCALPKHSARADLDALVASLEHTSKRADIEIAGAGARIVPVRTLNASFADTRNKSITHWRATAPLLTRSWHEHAHEGLEMVVDRHGGRMRYSALLARTFRRCTVHVILETPPSSQYLVLERGSGDDATPRDERAHDTASIADTSRPGDGRVVRHMRITFAERAESDSFCVALASCFAKYARETCMDAFNAYFGSLQPGLKPTAGYRNDAWRWLEEAVAAIERSGVARRDLVRER